MFTPTDNSPKALITGLLISLALWSICFAIQQALGLPQFHLASGWRWFIITLFLLDGVGTSAWALSIKRTADHTQLIDSGPYALVRHPVYGSILWDGTGVAAFLLESWLVLLAVIPLHLIWIYIVHPEETALWQRFGDQYLAYSKVTGQFLPRLSQLKNIKPPQDD